jgi:hypothetical protein
VSRPAGSWTPVTDIRLPGGLRLVVLPAPASTVVEARLVLTGQVVEATASPDRLDACLRELVVPASRDPQPAPRDRLRRELLGERFAVLPRMPGSSDLLLLAGAVESSAAVAAAARHLGGFVPAGRRRSRMRARDSFTPVRIVDDPDASYATVLAAAPAPEPSDGAFAAVLLAAELAGAALHRGLSSRFAGLLSASCVVEHSGGAWLSVEADVLDAGAAEVAAAVLDELAATDWHVPAAEDWQAARAGTFRSTVVALAGTAQTATTCAEAVADGLPPAFWPTLPELLDRVDPADVTAAARRYLTRHSFAVVASGPPLDQEGQGHGRPR